ncbi:MAG TPA: sodium-dependent bicarbonate transport family permease [Pseudoalteromonas sp.]|mgnify:FL=1|uniref:Permease n=1 Tax=marine sediment metagenome TaxID=412755 RepID=A0A0F9RNY5_9ZZZZ|nr:MULTISPECIES: sodium-dependent bicarbonate transport family permease [unclassified Pseudoalteromonas]HDY93857.1 sodium-dependent bicarbonate transport family permease [Pseudoalteromonas sp.]HDZ34354.1 sodium-dependent bicarbonate transport family permease [Pseudoalteromonas sp.]
MPDIVVMFFILGLVAGILRSDLAIPKATYDTLSLLLMLTIGLKGGMVLHGNLSWQLLPEMGSVMLLGALIPLMLYPILKYVIKLSVANSASIAAHYGSVSAGTFAVALAYAESAKLVVGAEVTLYLVMLELPAIIVGLLLYRKLDKQNSQKSEPSLKALWHETLTNKSVILLIGGVVIGMMYGTVQGSQVTSLLTSSFKVVLALFLLEMGLVAAQTLRPIPWEHWKLAVFAIVTPLFLGTIGTAVGTLLNLELGSVVILGSLVASASYIAAPAAIKAAIPKADIGLAMLSSLGVTFPFNVIVGIGLYHHLALAMQ